MGENSRGLRISDMGLNLAGNTQCALIDAPVGRVPDPGLTQSSKRPPLGGRQWFCQRAFASGARSLRMTKALTSIRVYCSQVYSPVLNTINHDFPRRHALFTAAAQSVRSGRSREIPVFPGPGLGDGGRARLLPWPKVDPLIKTKSPGV